ncbi:MAG: thioredoxin domain-containing protein, partial [Planctomycetota bacterium]
QESGALFATARHGRAHLNAYLDDYAFLIQGMLDLYETDFDQRWIRRALELSRIVGERFEDQQHGGYFTTSNDHERLIARLKSPQDGALPAGNGVHALNLLRLAELTGQRDLALAAERTIKSVGQLVNRYPVAFSQLLCAVDFLAGNPREVVIAGEPGDEPVRAMLKSVRARFLPQKVVALASESSDSVLMPLLAARKAPRGEARAFVCRNYACRSPVATVEALEGELGS